MWADDLGRAVVLSAALIAATAQAVSLRVANPGDAQSMDPHALNEARQLSLRGPVDELIYAVQSETDPTRRKALISETFDLHARDIGHIPLHQQALAWGVKTNVDLVQSPDNLMPFKWVTVK